MNIDIHFLRNVLDEKLRKVLIDPEESACAVSLVLQSLVLNFGGMRIPYRLPSHERDAEIYDLSITGVKPMDIASRFGIGRASVYRAIRRHLARIRNVSKAA